MTPLMISLLAFLGVTGIFGVLFLVLGGDKASRMSDRLDTLTGRKKKDDETSNILRKSAVDRDKQNFWELLTPKFLTFDKLFMQADCNIKPSTLFGIGL